MMGLVTVLVLVIGGSVGLRIFKEALCLARNSAMISLADFIFLTENLGFGLEPDGNVEVDWETAIGTGVVLEVGVGPVDVVLSRFIAVVGGLDLVIAGTSGSEEKSMKLQFRVIE